MKEKFSLLDIRAMVFDLKRKEVEGKYIKNIYSTKQNTFYFKLSTKDVIVIETGTRFYISADYDSNINFFAEKLRKKIRNTKILSIEQFGWDKIVVIELPRNRIVIEFYNAGNMILLDKDDDTIVEILRPVEKLGILKSTKYVWNKVELEISRERLLSSESIKSVLPFEDAALDVIRRKMSKMDENSDYSGLEEFISSFLSFKESIGEIIYKNNKPESFYPFCTSDASFVVDESLKYDYEAILESLPKRKTVIHFKSFNQAAGFYYYIKLGRKALGASAASGISSKTPEVSKIDKIHKSQLSYIKQLEIQSDAIVDHVETIENNRELISGILAIFNEVFSSRMEWSSFQHYYESEKKKGNPYSQAIQSYDLKNKTCLVKVDESIVNLDLKLSLHKNIESLFRGKKKYDMKIQKTREAMKNVSLQLKSSVPKKSAVKVQKREPYWFEKFHYYITSDKKLVIGGKNAQQNDLVVKKYLGSGDTYLHCDVHGASSIVLQGRSEESLKEASYMSLVLSRCWDDQIVKDVFWVESNQVSKSAPTGTFLKKGGFMIRDTKNFLYPHKLEYGIALVFKLRDAVDTLDFVTEIDGEKHPDILHAMPINGPWFILSKYFYSVRILPGTVKKQVLAESISSTFNLKSEGRFEETFVKAIGLQEYINVIFNKCKLAKINK